MKNRHIKLCKALSGIVVTLAIASCASPDERTYEEGWYVTRNQCGDVSSTIHNKKVFEVSQDRKITLLDQQSRNIYKLEIRATRAGVKYHSTRYSNDLANRELAKKSINNNGINKDSNAAIDTYFDQPGKHKELDFGCLFKGAAR